MNTLNFLKQPYPIPYQSFKTPLAIGFSLSVLMLLMQPFGLSGINISHKFYFLAGYGLVTFLVLYINLNFIIRLFSEYRWTVFKHTLWNCWIVFGLGLANYAYTYFFINNFPFSFSTLLSFQIYTLFIALIPITFLVLLKQNQLLKSNEIGAKALITTLETSKENQRNLETEICFIADNGKNQLKVTSSKLAFIESVGNYIHVYYELDGQITEKVLRSSISKAEQNVAKYPNLLKCHRAFIVNVNFIQQAKGNAQGYRLTIKNTDKEVYVSRQYVKNLKQITT